MKRAVELLAPGGDVDAIKAAILAGADAIYCGLDKFNARNRATNLSFDKLYGILKLAHKNNCQIFITLNVLLTDSELPALFKLLNKLVNTSIDGIIIQDLGLFYILNKYFPSLPIHASTQLTTHNQGQIDFLHQLKATRVNLSRELNITEIESLTAHSHKNNMLTEVFIHGSNCISFSGQCYMSSVQSGNSGNRGRCSQPCRDKYSSDNSQIEYPINLKDNSAFTDVDELMHAGVDSLKIEGRIKKYDYVYSVVKVWKQQLDQYRNGDTLSKDKSELYKSFNRDLSNGFLKNKISKDLFIDNPRDHTIKRLSLLHKKEKPAIIDQYQRDLLDEKEAKSKEVKEQIDTHSIDKSPFDIKLSGVCGEQLKIEIISGDKSFTLQSEITLSDQGQAELSKELITDKFRSLNDSAYQLGDIDLSNLTDVVYLPFKELNRIKKEILYYLNDSRKNIAAVQTPKLARSYRSQKAHLLSVLISTPEEIELCGDIETIYYQLPNAIHHQKTKLIQLFTKHTKLIPWFPTILIGEDFDAAIDFIKSIKPEEIISNNLGIGYEAYKQGVNWIAGPHLNIVNSFSLLCLKEEFNCSGAFISNEISQAQIQGIKKPNDFDLHYSIYHPIVLMTSRLCLNHQINKCQKKVMDENCLPHCATSSEISNSKNESSYITKSKGNYHEMYHETHYLNTQVIHDYSNLFSEFMIDLRDVKTKTHIDAHNQELIRVFKNYIEGTSKDELENVIQATTCKQYLKGI
ncbi:DUF3656 domain-containing U32 family peptidase [Carboxylicivirga sp. N1Y90]|uniref:DUF3656 domain-containing U32 family peptidase n=1 Tax=Carboxylicivirga fragile TaxID=3417571 RepID=UPI003D34419F|nr:DUF3656 domain-containing protein [Marinilabiliaceae bacterium N1Y90]